jgi:hypothetical protein
VFMLHRASAVPLGFRGQATGEGLFEEGTQERRPRRRRLKKWAVRGAGPAVWSTEHEAWSEGDLRDQSPWTGDSRHDGRVDTTHERTDTVSAEAAD